MTVPCYGSRCRGENRIVGTTLRYHAAHTASNRMYWCGCMPSFRVGAREKFPSKLYGWAKRNGFKSFLRNK